jgi:hypothetical protein
MITLRATWLYRWVVVVSGSLAISAAAILWIVDRIWRVYKPVLTE